MSNTQEQGKEQCLYPEARLVWLANLVVLEGIALALLFAFFRRPAVSAGLILGSLTSSISFRHLIASTDRLVRQQKTKIQAAAFRSYVARLALAAGALVLATIRTDVSFMATLAGLVLLQANIVLLYTARALWPGSCLARLLP